MTSKQWVIRRKDLDGNGLYWRGLAEDQELGQVDTRSEEWTADITDVPVFYVFSAKLSAQRAYRDAHKQFSPTTLELVDVAEMATKAADAEAKAAAYAQGSATVATDPAAFGEAEEPAEEWDDEPLDAEVVEEDPSAEVDLSQADAGELFTLANKYHANAAQSAQEFIRWAVKSGQALVAASELCAHGEWMSWVQANFKGSHDLANKYMRMARNSERVLSLDPDTSMRDALKALTRGVGTATDGKGAKEGKRNTMARTDAMRQTAAGVKAIDAAHHQARGVGGGAGEDRPGRSDRSGAAAQRVRRSTTGRGEPGGTADSRGLSRTWPARERGCATGQFRPNQTNKGKRNDCRNDHLLDIGLGHHQRNRRNSKRQGRDGLLPVGRTARCVRFHLCVCRQAGGAEGHVRPHLPEVQRHAEPSDRADRVRVLAVQDGSACVPPGGVACRWRASSLLPGVSVLRRPQQMSTHGS